MIIRIDKHKRHLGITTAHVPYELNATMRRFEAARWDTEAKVYLIEDVHVEAFLRFIKIHGGHMVLDDRPVIGGAQRPGPLPECSVCGQPAARAAALRLLVCPTCAAPWVPTVFREVRGLRSHPPDLEVPPF